jgi:phosphomannomutase
MAQAAGRVVGYEANGGFILGFSAQGPSGHLPALMTRDAMLPLLCVLSQAKKTGVAGLVAAQPSRFTAADRLQEVEVAKSLALLNALSSDSTKRATFLGKLGGVPTQIDETDGLRMTLEDGRIVHLRQSGNAPELRIYVEANSRLEANNTLKTGMAITTNYLAGEVL